MEIPAHGFHSHQRHTPAGCSRQPWSWGLSAVSLYQQKPVGRQPAEGRARAFGRCFTIRGTDVGEKWFWWTTLAFQRADKWTTLPRPPTSPLSSWLFPGTLRGTNSFTPVFTAFRILRVIRTWGGSFSSMFQKTRNHVIFFIHFQHFHPFPIVHFSFSIFMILPGVPVD